MSGQAQLDSTAAQRILFEDVYLPSFVEKCAQHGITFPDEESVQAALESVAMLKGAEASEQSGIAKSAAADLRSALGIPTPEDPEAIKAAQDRAAETARGDRVRAAIDALAQVGAAE